MANPSNNPPLLEVKNLRVEFPTRRGTLLAVALATLPLTACLSRRADSAAPPSVEEAKEAQAKAAGIRRSPWPRCP